MYFLITSKFESWVSPEIHNFKSTIFYFVIGHFRCLVFSWKFVQWFLFFVFLWSVLSERSSSLKFSIYFMITNLATFPTTFCIIEKTWMTICKTILAETNPMLSILDGFHKFSKYFVRDTKTKSLKYVG